MRNGDNTSWSDFDPLPPDVPTKPRNWKVQLIGVALLLLGVACCVIGMKWGVTRNRVLIVLGTGEVIIGAGIALISWGKFHRILRAIGYALAMIVLLAGLTTLGLAQSVAANGDDAFVLLIIGAPMTFLGLGASLGQLSARRGGGGQMLSRAYNYENVTSRLQEVEREVEIERELKNR